MTLLPSAVLTALGLLVLMVISRFAMQYWIDFYAKDYGGLGVVLALYCWIAFSSALIVWAASLSPGARRPTPATAGLVELLHLSHC